MVKALIAGKTVPEVLSLASNRLRASREDIFKALQAEEITPAHRFCLGEIMAHIEELEARIARFDAELLRALHDAGYAAPLRLLQTLPGIDLMGGRMVAKSLERCPWLHQSPQFFGGLAISRSGLSKTEVCWWN